MRAEPIEAVIFDLDDTLIDRGASIHAYAGQLARDFGDRLSITEPHTLAAELIRIDRNGYNRERAQDIAAHAMWRQAPEPALIAEHWSLHMAVLAQPRAGLAATIDALERAGLRLGIVSNGPTLKQRRKVETLGLAQRVGTLLISDELGIAKPDERIFRLAASQLGVEPSACMFIGDNPEKDVRAAEAVGMRAVWFEAKLPWPDDLPAPRERVRALSEVPALLGLAC